ncbi:MAG: dihydrofolate reductase [Patescibacteria group bacterium]|nr:dihydrofolate reductase [Patescibacteria group bacterium]
MPAKYVAIAAITLDGKIALHKHHMSNWTSKEDKTFLRALLNKSDVIIVGKNTHKTAEKPLSKRNCLVISRSARRLTNKSALLTYVKPIKAEIQKIIRARGYKNIVVLGGAQTYTFCLKNDMLDELYLTIEPLAFGRGISLFEGDKNLNARFNLISTKQLNKAGSLLLYYKK